MPDRITQEQMDELKYCLASRKDKFPALLEEYTGIIAKPYIAFQYFSPADNYISDSDNCSIEELMEEVEIEVVADAWQSKGKTYRVGRRLHRTIIR